MTHSENVAAYEGFVSRCSGMGAKYNPGSPKLQLNALNVLLVNARQALANVKAAETEYNNLTNDREVVFREMPKLAASVILTLSASGARKETLSDARTFFRLMHGRRAKDRAPLPSADAAQKNRPKYGHLSYVSKADHFARLVEAISADPMYVTNEPALAVKGLKSTLKKMNDLNTEVSEVIAKLHQARLARNKVLYNAEDSMYETSKMIKQYVRAIFGLNSETYRPMKGVRLTKLNVR